MVLLWFPLGLLWYRADMARARRAGTAAAGQPPWGGGRVDGTTLGPVFPRSTPQTNRCGKQMIARIVARIAWPSEQSQRV